MCSTCDLNGCAGQWRQGGISDRAGDDPGGSGGAGGDLKEPMRVCQSAGLVVCMYSVVYQKVQPSDSSTRSML